MWVGVGIALFLLLIWQAGLFTQSRLSLSNVYFIPSQTSSEVIIVAIDDASLEAYGRSPVQWSRGVYADLIEALAGARVIAFDILFSEEEAEDGIFAEAMQNARQGDARTRFVLAGAGLQAAVEIEPEAAYPNGLRYNTALPLNQTITANADYIGYVNAFPDSDGTIRRQPSIVYPTVTAEQPSLSFSLAVYLAYLRIPAAALGQVVTAEGDTLFVTPERQLNTDSLGFWLQNYFGPPSTGTNGETERTFTVISLLDVTESRINPARITDKVVLVGLFDSSGSTDQFAVPSGAAGRLMPGVEIQANAIETLIQDKPITEQGRFSQAVMIVVLAVGSSLLYSYPRWYFKLLLWFALLVIGAIIAFVVFSTQLLQINLFHGGLALTLPVIITIGLDITREVRRRRRAEFLLQSVVQVSRQQLELKKIVRLIADDVQRILPNSIGSIWVKNNAGRFNSAYQWGNAITQSPVSELVEDTSTAQKIIIRDERTALPLVWQGQTLAVIVIRRVLDARQQESLRELAEQISPGLENAMLHTQVARQRDLLNSVLSGSPAGIIVLNSTFTIIRVNRAFDAFVDNELELANLTGANFLDVLERLYVEEDDLKKLRANFKRTTPFQQEVQIAQHTFNLTTALIDRNRQWVVVLADVTQLADLSRLKTRMIRMASHDLKNPLSRILGYADLITMDGGLTEEQETFMDYIVQSGNEMNSLIRDILSLEQLRSSGMTPEPLDLAQLVREVVMRHEPDMVRKQQRHIVEVVETLPINADYRQLSQVASNLISNAIKYTQEGGRITIRLIELDDVAHFEVADTGLGISPAAQQKLFTEFYRVRTEHTTNISGTGLGLSLVKSVVDAHNGRVWVESEEGVGSIFYVELPLTLESVEEFQNES